MVAGNRLHSRKQRQKNSNFRLRPNSIQTVFYCFKTVQILCYCCSQTVLLLFESCFGKCSNTVSRYCLLLLFGTLLFFKYCLRYCVFVVLFWSCNSLPKRLHVRVRKGFWSSREKQANKQMREFPLNKKTMIENKQRFFLQQQLQFA